MKISFFKRPFAFFTQYTLLIIASLAIVLRFINLDYQSLWLDEIYTMNMANPDNSIAEIYKLSQNTDPMSVVYFTLLNFCFKIFGYSSLAARAFSAFFGIVGIFLIYRLGTELRGRGAGL